MSEPEPNEGLRELALLEINFLNYFKLLPNEFEGLEADLTQMEVFGLANGGSFDEVFHRVPLVNPEDGSQVPVAFFEYAVDPIFGGVLLAVGRGDQGTVRSAGLQQ